MRFNLAGDFGKLKKLANDLGPARAERFLGDLSRDLGKEALRLVDEGFATGTDPSGKAWPKPHKSHRPMIDSGALRASFSANCTKERVLVQSSVPYAALFQRGVRFARGSGQRGLGPRKMLPSERLSPKWKTKLEGVFWRNVQQLLKGVRT